MVQKKNTLTRTGIVALLACVCCILWGSAIPVIKTGYRLMEVDAADTASQIVFAGVRFTLAGLLVLIFASIREKKVLIPDRTILKYAVPVCLAQTVGQYYFFYVGLAHASGVHGAIITGMNVFIAILMASLVFHYETLTKKKVIGCILGFAGIVVMNLQGAGGDDMFRFSFMGEGFVFMAQLFYAISSALIKKYSKKYNVVTMSGYQFMAGGVILILIGVMGGGSIAGGLVRDGAFTMSIAVPAVALLLYMAMISAVAYTLWGVLLKYNPVSRVSVFGFMNPVFGVLLSALILGESAQALSIYALAALVLVSLGIYVVNKPERQA